MFPPRPLNFVAVQLYGQERRDAERADDVRRDAVQDALAEARAARLVFYTRMELLARAHGLTPPKGAAYKFDASKGTLTVEWP